MHWTARPIRPLTMPVGSDGLTYDPGLVVETSRIASTVELADDPIWRAAPLTKEARKEIPQGLRRGWRVRRAGEREPCAIVLRVMIYYMRGCISAAPKRAEFWPGDALVVLTPQLVVSVPGTSKFAAYGYPADVINRDEAGATPEKPPVPESDLEALGVLAP